MTVFNYQLILNEIEQTLNSVNPESAQQFEQQVIDAPTVFVSGKGRSGFVANGFAMRLNQLGKKAHVVGESTTPSIQKGDIFVIISGSGSTAHLKLLAEKAKEVEADVLLITTKPDSAIGQLANLAIELPAGTKHDAEGSDQPLGSLFEQSAQLFLDSLVLNLQTRLNISEETMQHNHANLE
ncbi:6-phospho-3-hexuloisomerase [Staphylococcus agnetis]|uniref:6-phospho-3-hexuloisomerase n=1 Tax=Staphylococcus agnetis TaxID=985762 RepID=A0ABX3Z202_9STAP|nr:6-phospho-3-hexuloisomerase [Staphylococcus agnetis]ALN77888.1 6-phospho-3-hexuloisomerase [Staphylococcus agnetis]MDG4942892.1 6-phospho-3-hexuloisomerase [Staphylococcus agnetis]OSP22361.1 6-phospho-3-hexuloisomerase [Staphylococcus agnetis]OSP24183.1 6-phospho-3-hexuloisomerase [Staphylococcus agnetis]OTW30926.1 6-phospho-3-hexuloisomerase [Staphylococcus agnetis]